jgi:hypothetical protein
VFGWANDNTREHNAKKDTLAIHIPDTGKKGDRFILEVLCSRDYKNKSVPILFILLHGSSVVMIVTSNTLNIQLSGLG